MTDNEEPHETSAGETGRREAMSDERLAEIRHLVYAIDLPGGAYPSLTRELLAEVERLREVETKRGERIARQLSLARSLIERHKWLRGEAEAELRKLADLNRDLTNEAADATKRAEAAERALEEMWERDGAWEPGRWRRVRRPDGSLWMETSDHDEAQAEAEKTGWPLERLYVNTRSEWRVVGERGEADGG